jgi:hypothetical protein
LKTKILPVSGVGFAVAVTVAAQSYYVPLPRLEKRWRCICRALRCMRGEDCMFELYDAFMVHVGLEALRAS